MGLKSSVGLGLVVLVGAFASATSPTVAETRIAIAPSFLRLAGAPGGVGRVEIVVTDRGDTPFDVTVAKAPPDAIVADRSAVDWITVEPSRMQLAVGGTATATVTISIPEDARSGGRYAMVTFTMVAPEAKGTTTSMAGRIIVPVWIAVQGEEALMRIPAIERFAPVLEPDGRIGFALLARNDGNVHAQVAGTIHVRDLAGGPDAVLEMGVRGVLPDASVLFATDVTLPLPTGPTYRATLTLTSPIDMDPGAYEPIVETMTFEPTPSLTLSVPVACENLDRGPTLSTTLQNDGDVGAVVITRFDILDAGGAVVGTAAPKDQPISWPQEATASTAELADRLASGGYTLVVHAAYGFDGAIEQSAPFRVGGDPVGAIPLCADPASAAP